MEEKFKELTTFFETEYPLNKDGLKELFSLFKMKLFVKGEFLLSAEQEEKELRFLKSGIVREYYANSKKRTKNSRIRCLYS